MLQTVQSGDMYDASYEMKVNGLDWGNEEI